MILSALESDDGGGDYESEFTYYMSIFESDISVTDTGGGAYETISTTNASTATSSSSLRRTSRQHSQIAIGGYEGNPFFGGALRTQALRGIPGLSRRFGVSPY